jgi:hypothetical protein
MIHPEQGDRQKTVPRNLGLNLYRENAVGIKSAQPGFGPKHAQPGAIHRVRALACEGVAQVVHHARRQRKEVRRPDSLLKLTPSLANFGVDTQGDGKCVYSFHGFFKDCSYLFGINGWRLDQNTVVDL